MRLKLKESREPILAKENSELKDKLEKMEREFEIVQWYITVFEAGFNTKNILKDFVQAQEDIKNLTISAAQEKA